MEDAVDGRGKACDFTSVCCDVYMDKINTPIESSIHNDTITRLVSRLDAQLSWVNCRSKHAITVTKYKKVVLGNRAMPL